MISAFGTISQVGPPVLEHPGRTSFAGLLPAMMFHAHSGHDTQRLPQSLILIVQIRDDEVQRLVDGVVQFLEVSAQSRYLGRQTFNGLGVGQPAVAPNPDQAAEAAGCDITTIRTYLDSREILSFLTAIKESGERASKIVKNMLGSDGHAQRSPFPISDFSLRMPSITLSMVFSASSSDLSRGSSSPRGANHPRALLKREVGARRFDRSVPGSKIMRTASHTRSASPAFHYIICCVPRCGVSQIIRRSFSKAAACRTAG